MNTYIDEDNNKITSNENDRYHSFNDKPSIEFCNGALAWHVNGALSRNGSPAFIDHNGSKWWYRNGKIHRTDGPAIVRVDGSKEWWLNGIQVSENVFEYILFVYTFRNSRLALDNS